MADTTLLDDIAFFERALEEAKLEVADIETVLFALRWKLYSGEKEEV